MSGKPEFVTWRHSRSSRRPAACGSLASSWCDVLRTFDALSVPVRRVASVAAPRFAAAGAVGAVREPRAAAAAGGGLSTVAGAAKRSFCASFQARCALPHVVGLPHADHALMNGMPRSAIFNAFSRSVFDVLPMVVQPNAALRQPRARPEHAHTEVNEMHSAESRSCGVLHMQCGRAQSLVAMAAGARAAARAIASVS